jgi:hypothetical protein
MLKRTMDPATLNRVANSPDVRPTLGGSGPIDLSGLIADPNNIALECEFGGFLVVKLEPGVYECHSMFLTEGRGSEVLTAMRSGLNYMFVRTDCIEMVTKAPEGNKAAFGAARIMGFSVTYRLDKGWPLENGGFGPVDCMSLPIAKWMQKDAAVQERGEWFHTRLEEVTKGNLPAHYDEPSHNKAVGAAVLMFQAGNNIKAINIYNLWARRSGFAPIRALSLTPLIIDMDQVIVEISNGDMEVLRCQ